MILHALGDDDLKSKHAELDRDGFTVLSEFFTHDTMDMLRDEMENIIAKAEKENR